MHKTWLTVSRLISLFMLSKTRVCLSKKKGKDPIVKEREKKWLNLYFSLL